MGSEFGGFLKIPTTSKPPPSNNVSNSNTTNRAIECTISSMPAVAPKPVGLYNLGNRKM
ncbi:hypothetical protein HK102_007316, partial [Quaeritorhiza haematococci]